MKRLPHIEVILPIYNEVANLEPLMEQLEEVSRRLRDHATLSHLFVNDGSDDGSKELLHRLFRDREDIRVIDLIHNFGHGPAISCGLKYFQGDVAIVMDADMQDSPLAIIDLFARWQRGAKTVVAERGKREEQGKILFRLFYFLLHRTSDKFPQINFGTQCLLDKSVIERIRQMPERNLYFPGLVSLASSEIASVRVNRYRRLHGESRVGFWGLSHLAITALVSFSSSPVRLVALFGIACAAFAFTGGLTIMSIKLGTKYAIPGWASTMTVIAFGSGLQLFCLGIIGEYIARIYDEVKQRPLFLVDKILDKRSFKQPSMEVA